MKTRHIHVALLYVCSACAIGDVSRDGPAPRPSTARRDDASFPQEAVFCADLGGTVRLAGTGFSPMPRDVLAGDASIVLPTVELVSGGTRITLDGVRYDRASGELSATVPVSLAPGSYDVRVENPNGRAGTLAGAVVVVPPPQLSGVAPTRGPNDVATPVVLGGSDFRRSGDGVEPAVTMSPASGGASTPLSAVALTSASEVGASVPSGLAPGFYDLTLTNPEGCSSTLPAAYEVFEPAIIDLCSSVSPGFGWVASRTRIEICAHNGGGNGLQSTPEAFIVIGDEEIPLRREAFLDPGTASGDSVMAAVVPSASDDARVVVGGPYDVRVVNPDGSAGVITGAFTVLADPPPQIVAINPGRGDKDTAITLTIEGIDLKSGNLPGGATPIVGVHLLAADGVTELPCAVASVTLDTPSAGRDTVSCNITLPSATGGYVVRVRHDDDGSFDLFATFAVTDASRKLAQATSVQPTMSSRRRHHAAAVGVDDLGTRFVYALGGQDETGAALASGEVAAMTDFGQLLQWSTLPNALPAARTGLAVAQWKRYVYVVGGSPDGQSPFDPASGTTALQGPTVLRARILGADTAPRLGSATAGTSGSLPAGTYYYRVAAVMTAAGDNPSGETLASDEESVRVGDGGSVSLSWALPEGVASAAELQEYRVYRSATANARAGTGVFIATVAGSQTSFTDDGSATPDTSRTPLPVGSLGRWVSMASLSTPRFDASATVVEIDPTHAYLYVAGGRSGATDGAVLGSVEWIPIDSATGDLTGSWQAGGTITARAEHILVPISHALAETVPQGNFALAVAGGTSKARAGTGGGLSALQVSVLDANTGGSTTGQPGTWGAGGTTGNRVGLTGIVVNDFFYAFNGWSGSGGSFASASEKSGSTTCTGGPPCSPAFSSFSSATVSFSDGSGNNSAAYRSALVFFGAYFYFIGGSSGLNQTTTSNAVIRGTY